MTIVREGFNMKRLHLCGVELDVKWRRGFADDDGRTGSRGDDAGDEYY